MKVKITKTIDANQIPAESRKMFDLVKHSLTNAVPEKMNNAARYLYSSKGTANQTRRVSIHAPTPRGEAHLV